jgi:hypothetical protein
MRRTGSMVVAVALAATLAGCAGTLWGAGVPAEMGPKLAGPKSTLVVSVGPEGWAGASQVLSKALEGTFPLGLPLDGAGEIEGAGALISALWQDALVYFEGVELTVSPVGLELAVDLAMDQPLLIEVAIDGLAACVVSADVPAATLVFRVELWRDESGRITAAPGSEVTLDAGAISVEAIGCPAAELLGLDLEQPTELLGAALGQSVLDGIAPLVADVLPAGLGIDLATGWTVLYADDGVGAGQLSALIRAPQVGDGGRLWTFADGRMVVPFGVLVDAEAHACVPPSALPAAAGSPVPTVDAKAALLLHEDIVRRAVAAQWLAGGLCLDRVTRGVTWQAGDLVGSWPELAAFTPKTPLSLRLWPEEAPGVVALAEGDDGVSALVSTGLFAVEVMGRLDGAWVRLATLRLALDVDASLDVDPGTGEVWLTPEAVAVTAAATDEGFVGAPDLAALDALALPLAELLLSARPIWSLPPLPGGVPEEIRLAGAFLVFAAP